MEKRHSKQNKDVWGIRRMKDHQGELVVMAILVMETEVHAMDQL